MAPHIQKKLSEEKLYDLLLKMSIYTSCSQFLFEVPHILSSEKVKQLLSIKTLMEKQVYLNDFCLEDFAQEALGCTFSLWQKSAKAWNNHPKRKQILPVVTKVYQKMVEKNWRKTFNAIFVYLSNMLYVGAT